MSQWDDTGHKTFTAGAAIAQHLRVKLTAGKLAAATATETELGTLRDASFADGDPRTVLLNTKQGTVKMVAAAAIALGAKVYGAAGGKISSTADGVYVGTVLEAASGNNSIVEVLRDSQPNAAAHIADPAAGATVDAEARTAIDAILVVLENAGLTKST